MQPDSTGLATDLDVESVHSSSASALSSPSSVSLVDWASVSDADDFADVMRNVSSLSIHSLPPQSDPLPTPPGPTVEVLNISNEFLVDLLEIERPEVTQEDVPSSSTPLDVLPPAGDSAATPSVDATPAIEPDLVDVGTDLDNGAAMKPVDDVAPAVDSTTDAAPTDDVTPDVDPDRTYVPAPKSPSTAPVIASNVPRAESVVDEDFVHPATLRRGSTLVRSSAMRYPPPKPVEVRLPAEHWTCPLPPRFSMSHPPPPSAPGPKSYNEAKLDQNDTPSPKYAPNVPSWLTLSVQGSLERNSAPCTSDVATCIESPPLRTTSVPSLGGAQSESERPPSVTFFRSSRNPEMCSEIDVAEASNTVPNPFANNLFASPQAPSTRIHSPSYSSTSPPLPGSPPPRPPFSSQHGQSARVWVPPFTRTPSPTVPATGSCPSPTSPQSRWSTPEPALPSIVDWFPSILDAPTQPARIPTPSDSEESSAPWPTTGRLHPRPWRVATPNFYTDSESEALSSPPRIYSPAPRSPSPVPAATPPPNPRRLSRHLSSLWTRSRTQSNDEAFDSEEAPPPISSQSRSKRSYSMDATGAVSSPFTVPRPKPEPPKPNNPSSQPKAVPPRPPLPPIPKIKQAPSFTTPRAHIGCVVPPAAPTPTMVAPVPPVPVPVYPTPIFGHSAYAPVGPPGMPVIPRLPSSSTAHALPTYWVPPPPEMPASYGAYKPARPAVSNWGFVHPTPHNPWFKPAAGPSASIPSQRFYFPDGSVIFKVEGIEFKVHRHVFMKEDSILSRMMGPMSSYGSPSPVSTHEIQTVSALDFEKFLCVFYPSDYLTPDLHSVEEWTSVLRVAHTLDFPRLMRLAASKLTEIATPVERLVIAKSFTMSPDEFMLPAYRALCIPSRGTESAPPFTAEEAEQLGTKTTLAIWKLQGRAAKQIQDCGCLSRPLPGVYAPYIAPFAPQPPKAEKMCQYCSSVIDNLIADEFGLPGIYPAWGQPSIPMSRPGPWCTPPPRPSPSPPPPPPPGPPVAWDYISPRLVAKPVVSPPAVAMYPCSVDCICRGWGCATKP